MDGQIRQPNLHYEKIQAFSQKWQINEFSVFGSILRDDFDDESDVDVLVRFDETAHPTLFDLVRMNDELEQILGRKVDLLTRNSVENSENTIRHNSILEGTQVIYAK